MLPARGKVTIRHRTLFARVETTGDSVSPSRGTDVANHRAEVWTGIVGLPRARTVGPRDDDRLIDTRREIFTIPNPRHDYECRMAKDRTVENPFLRCRGRKKASTRSPQGVIITSPSPGRDMFQKKQRKSDDPTAWI